MSGALGQRPLFTNAPITPAAPTIPVVPSGSNLAAAMMHQPGAMSLPAPNFGGGVPLSSLIDMMKRQHTNPTPGNNQTGLVRGADGSWVAGPSMGGEMPALSVANDVPAQAQMPGMASPGAPGMASPGAPGMAMGPTPGMPSQAAVGMPGADQPGLLGQAIARLQSLYGGGG